ncbi:hypothetical protein [Clostridium sp.]|uniref:hypothetical protein n=1 Tax=Clostridium sp. TaxID=1506 RepID=UPI001B793F5D|nr:hypothetical protein [Clostridium sp.]MBP3917380.1 flagellar FliJ family protein [Clostridium sp.]
MASGFKFRFDTLLKLRENEEDSLRESFLKLKVEKEKQDYLLNSLKVEFNNNSFINNTETVFQQKIKKNYLVSVLEKIEIVEKKILILDKDIDKAREKLLQASINKKMLENLKKKEMNEFIKNERRKEEIINNEFALNNYYNELKGDDEYNEY